MVNKFVKRSFILWPLVAVYTLNLQKPKHNRAMLVTFYVVADLLWTRDTLSVMEFTSTFLFKTQSFCRTLQNIYIRTLLTCYSGGWYLGENIWMKMVNFSFHKTNQSSSGYMNSNSTFDPVLIFRCFKDFVISIHLLALHFSFNSEDRHPHTTIW